MEVEIMRFDETELRLGLPGGGGGGGGGELLAAHEVVGSTPTTPTTAHLMIRKRGFSETVDLQLNLSSSPAKDAAAPAKSEDCTSAGTPEKMEKNISLLQAQESAAAADLATSKPPPAKAQVVGWPPVRSFRKNMVSSAAVQKSTNNKTTSNKDGVSAAESEHKAAAPAAPSAAVAASGGGASFVKVSMDGAPYLRKVDLKMYGSYRELSDALTKMFGSVKESNDYVPTYEDKDGDWMLVGDVPWGMFVESCKRLRIMKGNEAIGLAPRAMEKRKNMS